MINWFYRTKSGQMLFFILVVILIPNLIEEAITRMFNLHFENTIWYEVVDTGLMLLVSVPVFWVLIVKLDDYVKEMEVLNAQNIQINETLKVKNKELERMAYFDDLTGLPNRFKLYHDLAENISRRGKPKESGNAAIGVMFIDLDRFQQINDTMGHFTGDQLIMEVGKRIGRMLPDHAAIYRHSGDEYVILAELDSEDAYIELARQVESLFIDPFVTAEAELYIKASMGISFYPQNGLHAETLIKNADQALKHAKEQGGGAITIFEGSMNYMAVRKVKLENGLRTAIEQEELLLYYQPKIDLKTKRITGVEALLRWRHPEFGVVSPDEFIPLAEETGMIVPIGRWVLETACQQLKKWHNAGLLHLTMAVNVSVRQLKRHAFPTFVAEVLRKNDLPAGFLEIEVTESMMQNFDESYRVFKQLRALGVNVSIDDFGTGYASLSALGFLPFDNLKIDRTFIREMTTNPKTNSIVRTIASLAQNMGVNVIAEGIEEHHQAKMLMDYGCKYGQGFLYSKPLPSEEMEKFMFMKQQVFSDESTGELA